MTKAAPRKTRKSNRQRCTRNSGSQQSEIVQKKELVPVSQEDHLTEDDPIVGQSYVCMSFVCPDEVLPCKTLFNLGKYLHDIFSQKVKTFTDAVSEDPSSVREFADKLITDTSDVEADFKVYVANNQTKLEEEFSAENPMKLTTSGFKVRGSYPTVEAARARAEMLQKTDTSVDVFLAQVGAWCPFSPCAESVGDVVYDETELNTLMKLKAEADKHRQDIYDAQTKKRIEAARQEGQVGALQTITEDEETVGDDNESEKDTRLDGWASITAEGDKDEVEDM